MMDGGRIEIGVLWTGDAKMLTIRYWKLGEQYTHNIRSFDKQLHFRFYNFIKKMGLGFIELIKFI